MLTQPYATICNLNATLTQPSTSKNATFSLKIRNCINDSVKVDDGFSGIDRTRPAFCRLLRDCEQGKIDIVLCKDQSRFSRDTVVIEQYLNDRFLEWGVRFIGVADNADTDSESYGTMRLFTSAYNEMYVKDISAKIRRTLS
ncbi:MAG: recombinase family protein, partial [Oscillospiraceae bacterium]|nr:recombinase family protein [Oscillospiraceae bacterium]